MLILYLLAIFLSAALLFLVQPMAAKLVLPLLGGTPAVWTTCMLFFQVLLLAGYLYGHLTDKYLKPRLQVIVHVLVMLAAAASLPIALPAAAQDASGIIGRLPVQIAFSVWLLAILGMTVGAPFFVVSTTGPLLQRWFSRTGHSHAKDPYFLYAASNAGSMIGLAAYPLSFEPFLGVRAQGWTWSIGYGVFALLAALCGVMAIRRGVGMQGGPLIEVKPADEPATVLPWRRKLRWLALATVPSSLMLGVTLQVSTDLASMPLLWIVPLGLYLLTFILAFSPRMRISTGSLGFALVLLAPATIATMMLGLKGPLGVLLAMHFVTFFIAALMCHRLLADERPAPEHLTTFYLIMAAGGVLGGIFNSLVAPVAFNNVYEYPIALAGALLLRPATSLFLGKGKPKAAAAPPAETSAQSAAEPATPSVQLPWMTIAVRRAVLPLAMLAIMVAVGVFCARRDWQRQIGLELAWALEPWLRVALPLLIMVFAIRRPIQFACCFMVLSASAYFVDPSSFSKLIYQERSFFGVLRITEQFNGAWRTLSHGTTNHGSQNFTSEEVRRAPMTYYYPTGPLGRVFAAIEGEPRDKSIAVVGLGTGSLAAYANPGDKYTFYEIDSAVVNIATGKGKSQPYFTYLKECLGDVQVILADGRLGIQSHAQDGEYGVIVLDAFSSDAIPVHLMTKEAFELYLRKLMPDGLLLVHVSNRHFELAPVVARLAKELGCVSHVSQDPRLSDEEKERGKQPSRWMVIARNARAVPAALNERDGHYPEIVAGARAPLWTDDYSNVLEVMKFD